MSPSDNAKAAASNGRVRLVGRQHVGSLGQGRQGAPSSLPRRAWTDAAAAGVAKPPKYLRSDDSIRITIGGVGTLDNSVSTAA